MKNKTLIYFFIISFFSLSSVNGQITVSPEIGLSYLPFTIYPGVFRVGGLLNSKKVNLLLGVSAQLPIHKKWDAKLRISYTNRSDVEWREFADSGSYFDFEWKHQHLNIDLNFRYNLYENLSIGIGPSLIRYFAERNENRGDDENAQIKGNIFLFALNSGISFKIERININLMYVRMHKYNAQKIQRTPNANNRIDLTIGYRIGKGK